MLAKKKRISPIMAKRGMEWPKEEQQDELWTTNFDE
jgi:hypothetical protein